MAALAALEALSRALPRLPPALAAELQADLAKLIMQHSFIQARCSNSPRACIGNLIFSVRAGILSIILAMLRCVPSLAVERDELLQHTDRFDKEPLQHSWRVMLCMPCRL